MPYGEIDKDTVRAAREGSLVAFEQIMLAFERPLYNHLYRTVSHRQTAEDLLQETFMKAFRAAGRLDPEGNVRAWLYTVATNVANDHLRKRYRKPEVYLDEEPAALETETQDTPYSVLEREYDAAEVRGGLSKLKPAYRTVLLLYYKEELSYEEIASVLGVPLGTVKTNLHRAKTALAELLEPHNPNRT